MTAGLRVVIVDDEEPARAILREYLQQEAGVEIVAECSNGFEAVQAVANLRPDVLLLDAQMPKLDGFEVLELIDRHPGTGSSTGLAKLILSLWNGDCAFSFRECVSSFDPARSDLARRIITHFLAHGEDDDLCRAGDHICETHGELWDLGQAAADAKAKLRQQWETERRAS